MNEDIEKSYKAETKLCLKPFNMHVLFLYKYSLV